MPVEFGSLHRRGLPLPNVRGYYWKGRHRISIPNVMFFETDNPRNSSPIAAVPIPCRNADTLLDARESAISAAPSVCWVPPDRAGQTGKTGTYEPVSG